MNTNTTTVRRWLTAALLAAGMAMLQPAAAQQSGDQDDAQVHAFMQKRAELTKLQEQLAQIQQKTVDKRPALKKQQHDFRQLMLDKMKAKGHTPEKDIDHLKQLEAQLHDKSVTADKRKDLLVDLRETSERLHQEQMEIMQDKDVQASRQSLVNAILKAMHEEDPRTDDLIKQAHDKEMELVAIQRQVNGQPPAAAPKSK